MGDIGEEKYIKLSELYEGERGSIGKIGSSVVSRRLCELGFVRGATVEKLGSSPFGDPSAFLVNGSAVALRREDSDGIYITRCGGEKKWD